MCLNIVAHCFYPNNILRRIVCGINNTLNLLVLGLLFVKLLMTVRVEGSLIHNVYGSRLEFLEANKHLNPIESTLIFTTPLGDAILILAVFIGTLCVDLLGNKDLFKSISNVVLYFMFVIAVMIMVTTNNLLIMFLSFELIFIPTVYYAYNKGYSRKADKASEILFY